MLTLLINVALGGIITLTLVSLVASVRSFLPAWRRLSAELAAYDDHHTLRVTLRELTHSPESATVYRPAFVKRQPAPLRPSLHAAA
jgi:hypothetical protein